MIILIEVGTSGGTRYFATEAYTSGSSDTPPNQFYDNRVKSAGSIEQHLFGSGDGSSDGGSSVGLGNVTLLNGTPYGGTGTIDDLLSVALTSIKIKSIVDSSKSLSSATTWFVGTIESLTSTKALSQFDLVLHDRLSDLNQPLLLATYAGTTTSTGLGIEGNVGLTGQVKQKIWGTKNNAPCINVNEFDLLYQVNDGAVSSIVVKDGGIALSNAGDFPNLAALLAATLIPGQYATCLTLGIFRLGGQAVAAVTANVVEGSTLASRSCAQIASRIVAWFASVYPDIAPSISSASIAALDVKNSAECGVLVTSNENALSVLQRLLKSVGGWILPDNTSTTLFNIGRLDTSFGTSVATFDLEDNLNDEVERVETGDNGNGIPAGRVIVKYDQIGVVQTGGELYGNVSSSDRSYLGQEWRQTPAAVNSATVTQYGGKAPTITIETCLVNSADAVAEAARELAMRSVRRDCYRMKLPLTDAAPCAFGTATTIISEAGRLELESGKRFTPLGININLDDFPTATVDFWG